MNIKYIKTLSILILSIASITYLTDLHSRRVNYYNPSFNPTTIATPEDESFNTYINYYGIPQEYNITPSDAAEYQRDAQLHSSYDQDDMYDKLYWDRVDGDAYAMFANRRSDDDFIWNY